MILNKSNTKTDGNIVDQMFEVGAHFGYERSRRHPSALPYIFGVKNKVEIFDLEKVSLKLDTALEFIKKVASEGQQILIVGGKKEASQIVKDGADKIAMPYVNGRWIGGTLTNSDQVRKAITKLLHMRDVVDKPLAHMKKKQVSMLKKDLDRLEKNVSGIVSLRTPPAALVVVDVRRESTAVKEAKACGIPVIALVDTNSSTYGINTVIPANDDSFKSVGFILEKLEEAALKGQEEFYSKYPDRRKKDEVAYERRVLVEKEKRPSERAMTQHADSDSSSRPGGQQRPGQKSFAQRRDGAKRGGFSGSGERRSPSSSGPRDGKRPPMSGGGRSFSGPRPSGPRTPRPMQATNQIVGDVSSTGNDKKE